MRRLLKYSVLILMVVMSVSSAWAYSYTQHVTTAPNNKGDALIFPWYLALDGGWDSKFTVINTDTDNAVVAKVVIRSFKNSEELLDFLIYLSPSDVFTFKIKYEGGRVILNTTDDSTPYSLGTPVVWANETAINQPFFALDCKDDADFLGYVEVIMAAYKPATVGTAKARIYQGYAETSVAVQNVAPADATKSIGAMILPNNTTFTGIYNPNSLAGYMELQNAVLGLSTSLRATAVKDYDTSVKLTTAVETKFGEASSENTLGELEGALSKNNIAMPYVNGVNTAIHFFTFPTKLTQRNSDCSILNPDSPYFKQNSINTKVEKLNEWCVEYTARPFDLTEKTPSSGPFSGGGTVYKMCNEVNFAGSADFGFAEGWAKYVFTHATTLTDTVNNNDLEVYGVPVIPTYLILGSLGLQVNYGAWSDTRVENCVEVLPDYQYTDYYTGTAVCPSL